MLFWYRNAVCSNNRHLRTGRGIKGRHGVGVLCLACMAGAVAQAQDRQPSGLLARFDVTQRLEYSDNPDFVADGESDFFGRTVLGFGLESITKVQRFSLDLGVDLEEWRDGQSTLDLENPFVQLDYIRDTRSSSLGFDLRYRESDSTSSPSDGDFDQDGNVINQDSSTRASYGFGVEGIFGRDAPIGASFNWRYNEISYSGNDASNLNDSSLNDFSGQIDFRIDRRITTSLTGKYINSETDGSGVDRETTGLGAAASLDVTPILTVDLGLSYDQIDRSGNETGTDDGVSSSLDMVLQRPNGTWALRYASDVTSNDAGRRAFLAVDRDMELPRGDLSVSLGLTGVDTIGEDPLVQVDYRHNLQTAFLTFGLSQRVVTDDNNNEEINTSLRAAYDQTINRVSGYGVSVDFFNRNELSETPNDGQRIDVNLTYRHDLTKDWGVVGGIRHSLSTEDTGRDRRSNTVFMGLQRSFNWTP